MTAVSLSGWSLMAMIVGAAGAFACLAATLHVFRHRSGPAHWLVAAGLGASGVLLALTLSTSIDPRLVWLTEAARNLFWLAAAHAIFAGEADPEARSPVRPLVFALAMVALLQVPLVVVSQWFAAWDGAQRMIAHSGSAFWMIFAIGMLVLTYNIYRAAAGMRAPWVRSFGAAMLVAWGYELNLHTIAYMDGAQDGSLFALRGIAWATVAVLLVRTRKDAAARGQRAPRSAAFQFLPLFIVAIYLLAMLAIDRATADYGFDIGSLGNFTMVVATLAAALLLASPQLRARCREAMARHLFGERYDYREEWRDFARRMSADVDDATALGRRAVQALAAITQSDAGLLLDADGEGGFALAARWQWPTAEVPSNAIAMDEARALLTGQPVVALDDARSESASMPEWLRDEPRAWAMVPLGDGARPEAVIVLARPGFARALDHEDRELLAVAAQQLAVHLSQQKAQMRLTENARFDDFNRRMAFVMHDIKNLSSQLSLTVANAERHIEKPEFRKDMLATLSGAAQRLEKLVGRLSGYGGLDDGDRETLHLSGLAQEVAASYPGQNLVVGYGGDATIRGNRAAVVQIVQHLVQNAFDASDADGAVHLDFLIGEFHAGISVSDSGSGMSAEFVRSSLFAPFVSTKVDGFGIGAYEAREMAKAMGGRIEVESREGLGSRLVLWLPRAELHRLYDALDSSREREVA